MYQDGESTTCAVCGVALVPFKELRGSSDEPEEEVDPLDERFPVLFAGRGRGALALLSLTGLALFFLPWIHLVLPEIADLSGFFLSRRLGWSWGAAVAWVVLFPTIASRRSIRQLRGARVAAAFLAAVPGTTAAILLARRPAAGPVPLSFSFAWPLPAMLVVSVVAVAVAILALGGRVDDVKVRRGSSAGETLH
jgi:hypothetical protein